jgi:hypothetical protein
MDVFCVPHFDLVVFGVLVEVINVVEEVVGVDVETPDVKVEDAEVKAEDEVVKVDDVETDVEIDVEVGNDDVAVGAVVPAPHAVTSLSSKVMAEPAYKPPDTDAPVSRLMANKARILPSKEVLVPRVAEPATTQ